MKCFKNVMINSFSTFHFEEFLNMLRLVVIKMLWIPIKIWYTRVERRDKNNSLKVMRCLRKVLLNFHQPDGLQVCNECHYSQGQRWIYIFLNLEKTLTEINRTMLFQQAWKRQKHFLMMNTWKTLLAQVMTNISISNACVTIALKKWATPQITSCTLFSEWSC